MPTATADAAAFSLSLTLSPPRTASTSPGTSAVITPSSTSTRRPPSVRGRLSTTPRPSLSLTSLVGDSDEEDGDAILKPDPTGGEGDAPADNRQEDYGPRRKIQRRTSRIARPKDSMPYARRRAANARGRFRSGGGGGGRGRFASSSSSQSRAPGGCMGPVPIMDRSALASGYNDVDGIDSKIEQEVQLDMPPPLCLTHGEPCVLLACKRGKNIGRHFFKCARPRFQQCDFFKWADEVLTSQMGGGDDDDDFNSNVVQWHVAEKVNEHMDIDSLLTDVFGYDKWQDGQRAAVQKLLDGISVLAVLPTAGGKSFIYQMVAAASMGFVIVVTPLVALMHSQKREMPPCLPCAALHGGLSQADAKKVLDDVRGGHIKLLFVAPERLMTRAFKASLSDTGQGQEVPVSLVVIDEAHCVSQWGHNFRTAYLRLPGLLFGRENEEEKEEVEEHEKVDDEVQKKSEVERKERSIFGRRKKDKQVPVLALTATATADTMADICERFKIDRGAGLIHVDCSRENMALTLSATGHGVDAKASELIRRLKSHPFAEMLGIETDKGKEKKVTSAAINSNDNDDEGEEQNSTTLVATKKRRVIVSSHADDDDLAWGSNRHVTKRVQASKKKRGRKPTGSIIIYVAKQRDCDSLRNYLASSSVLTHGRVAAYHGGMTTAERGKVQSAFEKGGICILVATVAFGMGVHCDRVKAVIHFDLPGSIEAYVQEIGRAGRDGSYAHCHAFFSERDGKRLISRAYSDGVDMNVVRQVIRKLIESRFEPADLSREGGEDGVKGKRKGKGKEGTGTGRNVIKTKNQRKSEEEDDEEDQELEQKDKDVVNNDDNEDKDDDHALILSLSAFDLCKTFDVKLETGETIIALLERMISGIELQRPMNSKFVIRFFAETPSALLASRKAKALTCYDRGVLSLIVNNAKHSTGQYTLHTTAACVTEGMISSSLRRMQANGLLSFDASELAITVQTSRKAVRRLETQLRTVSESVYDEMKNMESTRVKKAKRLVDMLRKADGIPSDRGQSTFLHAALDRYFQGLEEVVEDKEENKNNDDSGGQGQDIEDKDEDEDAERLEEVRKAAEYVCNETGCGRATAKTGRQVAKVLHGLDGARLTAKEWWRCKQWGRYVDVDFETVRRIACQVVRERHEQRH